MVHLGEAFCYFRLDADYADTTNLLFPLVLSPAESFIFRGGCCRPFRWHSQPSFGAFGFQAP